MVLSYEIILSLSFSCFLLIHFCNYVAGQENSFTPFTILLVKSLGLKVFVTKSDRVITTIARLSIEFEKLPGPIT